MPKTLGWGRAKGRWIQVRSATSISLRPLVPMSPEASGLTCLSVQELSSIYTGPSGTGFSRLGIRPSLLIPPPDPFFLIYRGITQFRGLMPLAYPLVPAPGPDINFYVEVVHYYAPRSFDPGANVATVHFIARSTVAADGIPDRDPPMPEGPIGGPTAEIETGNLYWFWNAATGRRPGWRRGLG